LSTCNEISLMSRILIATGGLCALALVLALSFVDTGDALSPRADRGPRGDSLVNANTGETLTLEAVQKDVEWHRETARKLRALD